MQFIHSWSKNIFLKILTFSFSQRCFPYHKRENASHSTTAICHLWHIFQGIKLRNFSSSHSAPKFLEVVANSKKSVACKNRGNEKQSYTMWKVTWIQNGQGSTLTLTRFPLESKFTSWKVKKRKWTKILTRYGK